MGLGAPLTMGPGNYLWLLGHVRKPAFEDGRLIAKSFLVSGASLEGKTRSVPAAGGSQYLVDK